MYTCFVCDMEFEHYSRALQHALMEQHEILLPFDKDDEEADFTEIEELKRGR